MPVSALGEDLSAAFDRPDPPLRRKDPVRPDDLEIARRDGRKCQVRTSMQYKDPTFESVEVGEKFGPQVIAMDEH